ncbi:MAG: hypothetical protein BWY45_03380 [Euryarchaeota archaeon ADurb.Bin294]|jgi:hypothetical protein|nr:MAG: hypothetical protein BWY45_03380 [Euryarchaeota archaeon ADurb.Bin294]
MERRDLLLIGAATYTEKKNTPAENQKYQTQTPNSMKNMVVLHLPVLKLEAKIYHFQTPQQIGSWSITPHAARLGWPSERQIWSI